MHCSGEVGSITTVWVTNILPDVNTNTYENRSTFARVKAHLKNKRVTFFQFTVYIVVRNTTAMYAQEKYAT